MSDKCIVAVGDPSIGYDYYGPFEGENAEDDANSWTNRYIPAYEHTTLIWLEDPDDWAKPDVIEGEVTNVIDITDKLQPATLQPVSKPLEPTPIVNSKGKTIGIQTVIPGS